MKEENISHKNATKIKKSGHPTIEFICWILLNE